MQTRIICILHNVHRIHLPHQVLAELFAFQATEEPLSQTLRCLWCLLGHFRLVFRVCVGQRTNDRTMYNNKLEPTDSNRLAAWKRRIFLSAQFFGVITYGHTHITEMSLAYMCACVFILARFLGYVRLLVCHSRA